ncbi:YwqG family protein [Macrococcus bovicus]|uniref:YwqG family protein n=1 Tax=Macrococcus bovicus TaxID=69968 RepID=UPI0025A64395|nr:DUF1963 domain-containing protein [Macrococcus bovicus]WJP97385.1 DUF1963 domain-containing protein [Macrococcus bovicus]
MLNIQDVSYLMEEEQEAYQRFVEEVQKRDVPSRQYIGMRLSEMHGETLLASKIGGVPFLESLDDVPRDVKGNPMIMIAQINMSELPEDQTLFPVNQGLLQFWISTENNMYGLSLSQLNDNPNSRFVYIEDTETPLSFDEIRGYMQSLSYDEFSVPVQGVFSVEYHLGEQMITLHDYRGVEILLKIWNEVNPDFYLENIYDDYDDLMEAVYQTFSGEHPINQLGGYPTFIQEDPRLVDEELQVYEDLVLQIDSNRQGNAEIAWGDVGTANWFLKREDLRAMLFDDYLYNWDCS